MVKNENVVTAGPTSDNFIECNFSPLTVSVKRAARELNIGRTKVYELINEGQLKTIKIGRRTLVTMSSIHALVDQAA